MSTKKKPTIKCSWLLYGTGACVIAAPFVVYTKRWGGALYATAAAAAAFGSYTAVDVVKRYPFFKAGTGAIGKRCIIGLAFIRAIIGLPYVI